MKYLILLFFIQLSWASENETCDIVTSHEAASLASLNTPVNCLKDIKPLEIMRALNNHKVIPVFCKDCIPVFAQKPLATERMPSPKHKDDFIRGSFNELRKGLSQTMLELMSLRSNVEININGEDVAKSCNINSLLSEPKCMGNQVFKDEVLKVQNELANEFASTLNSDYAHQGLLNRSAKSSCSIPDKEILFAKNNYLENQLPVLVKALRKVKTSPEAKDAFAHELEKELNNLPPKDTNTARSEDKKKFRFEDYSEHPLLASLLDNPEELKKFISTSKENATAEELRAQLYNTGSKAYSDKLKKNCDGYFNTLKANLCGEDFKKNNFAVDTRKGIEMTKDITFSNTSLKDAKTKEGMIEYCQDIEFKNKNTVLFSDIQEVLTQGMAPNLKEAKYSTFASQSYIMNIKELKDSLCKIKQNPTDCAKEGEKKCETYKIWQATQSPDSKENHLLAAHDENINKVLRAMIGEPRGIQEETRIILVKEGILKNETGSYAKKDTPERKADYYKTETRTASTNTVAAPVAPAQTTASARSVAPNSYVQPSAPQQVVNSQPTAPQASPIVDENQIREDLKRELTARLMKQKETVSPDQLEKMVAKAYKENKKDPRTLSSQEVKDKTRELLEETPSVFGSKMPTGEARLSDDKSKQQREENLKFLKARYGNAAGSAADKVASGADIKTNDKGMRVVTLKDSEDLKVVVDDIKNLKGSTGEIAKLVQSKTVFILKVGEIDYKVSYDKENKIFVTSPKGFTPDLVTLQKIEIYLNRLRSETQKYSLKQMKDALSNNQVPE